MQTSPSNHRNALSYYLSNSIKLVQYLLTIVETVIFKDLIINLLSGSFNFNQPVKGPFCAEHHLLYTTVIQFPFEYLYVSNTKMMYVIKYTKQFLNIHLHKNHYLSRLKIRPSRRQCNLYEQSIAILNLLS